MAPSRSTRLLKEHHNGQQAHFLYATCSHRSRLSPSRWRRCSAGRHAELRQQRATIEAELEPLYAELRSPELTKAREAEVRAQIKTTREPMIELDRELAELTRELKGKTGMPAA